MLANILKHTTLVAAIIIALCLNVNASDLDDDIKIDDKIDKFDKLDRPGINIQFIKRSAKASAANSEGTEGSGDVAIGGFINKPGAKVGDVTIIFDGEDINAVSE